MTDLYCPTCDYNLTGLPENRCPECEAAFDSKGLFAASKVPLVDPYSLLTRLLVVPFLAGLLALPLTLLIGQMVGMLALGRVPLGVVFGSIYTANQVDRRIKATRVLRALHQRYMWEKFRGSFVGIGLMILVQVACFVGAVWLAILSHGSIPFL